MLHMSSPPPSCRSFRFLDIQEPNWRACVRIDDDSGEWKRSNGDHIPRVSESSALSLYGPEGEPAVLERTRPMFLQSIGHPPPPPRRVSAAIPSCDHPRVMYFKFRSFRSFSRLVQVLCDCILCWMFLSLLADASRRPGFPTLHSAYSAYFPFE